MTELGMKKVVPGDFDDVLAKVAAALKTEGFGILTEVDVKDTLRKKLDVEFRRYRILGACNPPLAHRALQAEIDAGLMMPCNVVVYESDGGQTVVNAVDPRITVAASGAAELRGLAEEIRQKLARALERI